MRLLGGRHLYAAPCGNRRRTPFIINMFLYYLQFYIFSQRNTYLDCLLVQYTCSWFYYFHIVALRDSNTHILAHHLFSKSFYCFCIIKFLVYLPFTFTALFSFRPKVVRRLKNLIGITNSFILTVKAPIFIYTKALFGVLIF